MTPREQARGEARTHAIQAVAELAHGVQILDVEVAGGAPRAEVLRTVALMRAALWVLDDAAWRDGRAGR